MILAALLFHLLAWAGPVALVVLGDRRLRSSAYALIPLGFLVQGFLLGSLSAVLHPWVAPGWGKAAGVVLVATLALWRALRWFQPRLRGFRCRAFSGRALAACLLGAALATADLVAIFSGQGFADERGRFFHSGETYFRPPMNNDLTRHVVIVNSLVRRAESTPFLPESRYSYQLYWHHFAALTVAPLVSWWHPVTNYPLVMGHVSAVALLFFFLLLWAMYTRRPSLFENRWLALALGVLVLAHADVLHFAYSILTQGAPGIEADWSGSPKPFRNFSAKLMGLTAPQHALFFFFFLGFLERRRWARDPWARFAFAMPCFAASPILSLFVFPVWWAGEAARLYDRPVRLFRLAFHGAGIVAAGLILYTLLLKENPVDLVSRPGTSGVELANAPAEQWLLFPFLWIATAGWLGLLALLALRKHRRAWPFVAVLLLALPFFNFVLSGQEIRRHFSMVVAVISAVYLIRAVPRRHLLWRRGIALAGLLSLPAHGYFLYCYLGKPSSLDTKIPWRDYHSMNEVIERRFPGQPVLAAVQPGSGGIGLEKPVPMEVTTSFSVPYHTAAHVKVNEAQMKVFRQMYRSRETLPYGRALGYRYTVWGPVEEKIWGERNRRRFIDGNEPLARTGSVALYEIRDSLAALAPGEGASASAAAGYADKLAQAEFPVEAIETCERQMESGRGDAAVAVLLARLDLQVGDAVSAVKVADWVLGSRPDLKEALHIRGGALMRLNYPLQAIESYRRLLAIDPGDARARNHLGLLLNQAGDYLGAEEQLQPIAQLATATPGVLINFAQSLLGQQRYKEALEPLRRCLEANKDPRLQLSAHLGLGEAYAGLQQREPASFHFTEVLKLDPASPTAQAYFRNPSRVTGP